MDFKLESGETVISSWDYGKCKGRKDKKANLTVTNKRIVSTKDYRKGVEKKEILVKDVKSLDSRVGVQRPSIPAILLGVYLLLFGLSTVGFGAIIFMEVISGFPVSKTVGLPMMIFGVFLMILAIMLLRIKRKFLLEINSMMGEEKGFVKKSKKKLILLGILFTYFLGGLIIGCVVSAQSVSAVIIADVLFIVLIIMWVVIIRKAGNKELASNYSAGKKIKIKFNYYEINKMLEEIGSAVLDAKAQQIQ